MEFEALPAESDPYYQDSKKFDQWQPQDSPSDDDDYLSSSDDDAFSSPDDTASANDYDPAHGAVADDNSGSSTNDDDSDRDFDDEDNNYEFEVEAQFPLPKSQEALRDKILNGYKPEPEPPEVGLRPIALTRLQNYSLSHWVVFQQTNTTRRAHERYSELFSAREEEPIMSIERCRRLAQKLTNFMPKYISICPGKCIAFTGDHKDKRVCDFLRKPKKGAPVACGRDRYLPGTEKPAAQFMVLPIAPIIRAMFANEEQSRLLRYRDNLVKAAIELFSKGAKVKYSDYANSKTHMDHLRKLGLFKDECDMLYIMSIDGAMLTLKKQSDCWFLILILLNLPPEIRYLAENVITVFATHSPEPPGNLSTFMYPVIEELLQMGEGIWIWDAIRSSYIMHRASVAGQSADQPGQNKDNGHLGINSLHGNFFNLKLTGMRSDVKGCKRIYWCITVPEGAKKVNPGRPDYDLDNLPEFTQQEYWDVIDLLESARTEKERKLITEKYGIVRLPLLAAFKTFAWPNFFFSDPFHLLYENNMANFWDLWTSITGPDEIPHLSAARAALFGQHVTRAMATIPASFTGPVRDPHLKRNTQYKMFEWKALCHWLTIPILIELEMPLAVIYNFAHFVRIVKFAMEITGRTEDDLAMIRTEIVKFLHEFQDIYVGVDSTKASRMRLSMFHLLYIPDHIRWNGSYRIGSQGTLERHIGVLERKIRSRKEPFVNLANKIYEEQLVKNLLFYYPSLRMSPEPEKPRVPVGRAPIKRKERNDPFSPFVQHLKAICQWLNIPYNRDADWLERFGKVPLRSGDYLRSRLNESRIGSKVARSSRYFEVSG